VTTPSGALPGLLVLTDRTQCRQPLPCTVSRAVDAGARAVVLREKDLPRAERAALAATLRAILAPVAGLLIIAGPDSLPCNDSSGPPPDRSPRDDPGLPAPDANSGCSPAGEGGAWAGDQVPGVAVHLASADPWPSLRPELVGRSCHNTAELAQAAREGCDYVTVSPVFATASKPGYGPALGLAGLAGLCRADVPPVYALAAIRPEQVPACRAAGAAGVAVMGTLMRDPVLTADYLAALPEVST
jgi:thiamine monophosphate synthase